MKPTTIKEVLQNTDSSLEYEDKWLVIDGETFFVYRRKFGSKKVETLVVTESERTAVDILTGD